MSSISSVGGNNSMMMQGMQGMRGMKRPDPTEMAENLFSKLDTSGQGYIEKADLQSAFDKVASSTNASSGTSSVDDMFAKLDADSDGKVTKAEFTDSLKKLADELDQQFQSSRMQGAMQMGGIGMGGMGGMPPPPPKDDAGFTKDELSSQLEEVGSSDSQRSGLLSSVIQNFDAADTNSDGKVSFQEAMAYQQSSSNTSGTTGTSATSSTGTATATSSANDTEAKVMLQIMRLMHAYMGDQNGNSASTLSVTA